MNQNLLDPNVSEPLSGLRTVTGEITSGSRPHRTLRLRNARIARAFNLSGKRVLELGCAEGLHCLYMAESAREVVGIDHRASVIGRANANKSVLGVSNVRFECGDIRDSSLLARIGDFDLIVAWGFLHRVTDIFSLLENLGPLTPALSLEWRTPVFPLMSRVSLAYHSPAGEILDPMNLRPLVRNGAGEGQAAAQGHKIEGDTGFWEPTPAAIRLLCRRLGFKHARLLGYGETLCSESRVVARHWGGHLIKWFAGKANHQLPLARVHMIFEKVSGSIEIKEPYSSEVRLPEWDYGVRFQSGRNAMPKGRRRLLKAIARKRHF